MWDNPYDVEMGLRARGQSQAEDHAVKHIPAQAAILLAAVLALAPAALAGRAAPMNYEDMADWLQFEGETEAGFDKQVAASKAAFLLS